MFSSCVTGFVYKYMIELQRDAGINIQYRAEYVCKTSMITYIWCWHVRNNYYSKRVPIVYLVCNMLAFATNSEGRPATRVDIVLTSINYQFRSVGFVTGEYWQYK